MRLASLLGPDLKATLATEPEALREALREFHPEDVAEIVSDLPLADAIALMQALGDDVASTVLERLSGERQLEVLGGLRTGDAADLIRSMAPDDRVDVLQMLPDAAAEQVISEIAQTEPSVAAEIRQLGAWAEDTAGGLMTTEYVAASPDTTVRQAMVEVRLASRERHIETIAYIYVCAAAERLVGVVSLRELILSEPEQTLEQIMTRHIMSVAPEDDQERVAVAIAKYDLSAIPVIDRQGSMLGVVTVDDVVDVVIEEATEDAQMVGGVVPLADSYFATSLSEFIWKRATWLVVLFLGQLFTTNVMKAHESTLAAAMELVLFVPLIIASGGNAGSQSSSLVIRALALGEMVPKDWGRVLSRELSIGLSLGMLLGMIGFARALATGDVAHPFGLAATVSLSVVAVVVMGTLVGSMMPLLIRRCGFDPAVSSTPFITSLVDVLGLVVYLNLAQLLLRFLL